MQQVLFNIPFLRGWWIIPPEGIPVSGFGAMLFLTFIACTFWAMRRGKRVGIAPEKVQDMVIWLFLTGIIGARILYMIQYSNQFPDKSLAALAGSFFQIWKGGIIFYGSALGGAIGYGLFYWYVLRKMNVSGWQLADAMAPVLALGLAIGRIGCYLNGCCWGQVAVEQVCPVPLGGAHFPLLPSHARDQMVRETALQSSAGFTIAPRDRGATAADPRSIVQYVEKDSPAEKVGLLPGDRIIQVNGKPNAIVVEVLGNADKAARALDELRKQPGASPESGEKSASFDDPKDYTAAVMHVDRPDAGITIVDSDSLGELIREWPRGQHELQLTVLREGKVVNISPFVPRTISLYPTQLYETVSMVLVIFVLIAYYPFRRHDGQLMVLCMMGYSIHRFINESLRIEPAVGMGLTLSQWGSVIIFAAALGMELYLRRVMPSRWAAAAPPPGPPAAVPAS